MPVRPARRTPFWLGMRSLGCLFWLGFCIVILLLFVVNWQQIQKTLEETHLLDRLGGSLAEDNPSPEDLTVLSSDTLAVPWAAPEELQPIVIETPRSGPENLSDEPFPEIVAAPLSTERAVNPEDPGLVSSPQDPAIPSVSIQRSPSIEEPTVQPQAVQTPPAQQPTVISPTAPSRERAVYFIRLDRDGAILRVKTPRILPDSDSPMLDALNALLQGPSRDELTRGMISLVPPGTRILSAAVRGTTAYINFSEDFQFNTYGVEGYIAQLRQIIWTATEFSTVKDVQVLIEGRRIDYLGEGIWIGSPINRNSL